MFCYSYKGFKPHDRLPKAGDPAKGLRIPRESDFEGHRYLIAWLPQTVGNRDVTLRGHTQNVVHTKMQRKGAVAHRRWNQTYRPVFEGLLQSCGAVVAHCGTSMLGAAVLEVSLVWSLPEDATSLPGETVESRAESRQAKQLLGKEHRPAWWCVCGAGGYYWIKFYWGNPCLSEQDPVSPTASPSHKGSLHKFLR